VANLESRCRLLVGGVVAIRRDVAVHMFLSIAFDATATSDTMMNNFFSNSLYSSFPMEITYNAVIF
jgi:hypothetical protein